VTLAPATVRAQAARALARELLSGRRSDGTPALFAPARLAFAGSLYASAIVAAAHAVAGVDSAVLRVLRFLDAPAAAVPESLTAGPLEILRLDNDPAAPEHGYALVALKGGR
jgi:hypothetical protein